MQSTAHSTFSLADLTEAERHLLADIRRRKAELLHEIQQLKDEISEVTSEMESLDDRKLGCLHTCANGMVTNNTNCTDVNDSTTAALRKKHMSVGCKKFNMDPRKGIDYLIQHKLLGTSAADVAEFLFKGEALNKRAIGDYLGEHMQFNCEVLGAFVSLHDFADLILVQALRQFLWSFRLPGESQKIDRMMECFAQRYCAQNSTIFANADVCYTLSYAIIMLNTSLHNPSVRDKPSVCQFVSMVRGIDEGSDLPRALLVNLYETIRAEPFRLPDAHDELMHTFFDPDKEGWLWKQGGRYKSWKRRWFILSEKCLYYFEHTTDKEPRGIIPLENIRVREVEEKCGSGGAGLGSSSVSSVVSSGKGYGFELYAGVGSEYIKACKTEHDGRVVEGKHTVYRMSAATREEQRQWIECIRRSISVNPFYEMLAARKRKQQNHGNQQHHTSTSGSNSIDRIQLGNTPFTTNLKSQRRLSSSTSSVSVTSSSL